MTDAHVGRLLVAAVHQAITDELPTRIDFYEHWLRGERLRDGCVGLAPMTAVIGFLRAEGQPYHAVMKRAGRFAADWTHDAMPSMTRRFLLSLPRGLRARAVLRVAARAIRDGYGPSRLTIGVRRGLAHVEIRQSLFCRVRGAQPAPQCDFHASLISTLLSAFDLPAALHIDSCAGAAGGTCAMTIDFATAAAPVSEAA
jgi:hypothetical protein